MTELARQDLAPIVELQAVELKRLLTENNRLSRRIDAMIGELGALGTLHRRELELRQESQDRLLQMLEAAHELLRRSQSARLEERPRPVAASQEVAAMTSEPEGPTCEAKEVPGIDGPTYESREAIEETAAAIKRVLQARRSKGRAHVLH